MPISTGMRDRGRELAERLAASELARQEYLAELSPMCPQDGLPGAYIGIVGEGGAAHLVFACPHGDRFTYNAQTGAISPLASTGMGEIHLEPLDRFKRAHPTQVGIAATP